MASHQSLKSVLVTLNALADGCPAFHKSHHQCHKRIELLTGGGRNGRRSILAKGKKNIGECMELIESLETVKLSKFLKPLPQKLLSSLLDEPELTSSIHIIDSCGRSKNKYIEECIRSEQEMSDTGLVVLFDTDYSWKATSTSESAKFVVIRSINSLADLMKSLQNILLGNWESIQEISIQFSLSLVVINNLSTFYWDSKEKGILANEFRALAKLFQKLQEKYGCSVLTQSWDVLFDIGQGETLKPGKEPSLLPKQFLQYYKHVYYITQLGNGDEKVREIAYTQ